jgi:hypothetical protein
VQNLTLSMLGPRESQLLNAKAKETEGLLGFAVQMLERHRAALAATDAATHGLLLAAGQAAQDFQGACAGPTTMPKEATQERMWRSTRRFVHMFHLAGGNTVPKAHVLLEHLVQRVPYLRRPRACTTYADESLNGVIARIARSCHRRHFGRAIHCKYKVLAELEAEGLLA